MIELVYLNFELFSSLVYIQKFGLIKAKNFHMFDAIIIFFSMNGLNNCLYIISHLLFISLILTKSFSRLALFP